MLVTSSKTNPDARPAFPALRWLQKIPPVGWVALAHFLLTVLYTFPLIGRFTDSLPGSLITDRDQNLWNLWWVRDSVFHLHNPFRTTYIYQPENISLYFHTLNPLNGLVSLPIQVLFGTVVAYNFIVFFSFVMAGVGSWLLLKYLCGDGKSAFATSLIFVYSAYHLFTLIGLMQLISLEWIPFYLLFLLKAVCEPTHRWRNAGWAAFFLVCIALIDWYYTTFTLGVTALYIVWVGVPQLWQRFRPQPQTDEAVPEPDLRIIVAVLALFGLVMSPVLWPMLHELNDTTYYLPDPNDIRQYSPDLLAFFIPPLNSSLLGWVGNSIGGLHTDLALVSQVYLGYVTLILAVVGLVVNRASRFWGVVGLVYWLLAFGPTLKINGTNTGLPMPFSLIQNWPIIKITRSPDRFIVITMLALAVMVAYGLAWLNQRLQGRLKVKGRSWILPGLVTGLLVLESIQLPFAVNPFEVSPFFQQLGQDKADYAILNLPGQSADWPGASRMAEQTVHHKRIFDGYISREYPHPFDSHTPAFEELTTLKFGQDILLNSSGATAQAEWLSTLSYYNVHYIVLDLPQNGKQNSHTDVQSYREAIQRIAPGKPVYTDSQIEAYTVPVAPTLRPFVQIGEGWHDPEPDTTAADTLYHRWASGPASLDLVWGGSTTLPVTLSFKWGVLKDQKNARVKLDNVVVWSGTLNPAQPQQIGLQLAPGTHHLNFEVDGTTVSPKSLGMGNDPRQLLFYLTEVSLQ